MSRTEVFGTRTFRLALAFAFAVAGATIAAFTLIYVEVSREDAARVGAILASEVRLNKDDAAERLSAALTARQTENIRRIDYVALFDTSGQRVLGNLTSLPTIPVDGEPHYFPGHALQAEGGDKQPAILVAARRADGGVTVIGRSLQDSRDVEASLLKAFKITFAPMIATILTIGVLFARRALRRLNNVHDAIIRIMEGDLDSRLPVSSERDEIDRIAAAVNLMLNEITRLLDQLKSVGDNVAHDLRGPLALVRIKIERALEEAPGPSDPHLATALGHLDRATVAIEALLRISAVENGPRNRHFHDVDLVAICEQARELFEPLAEAKRIGLSLNAPAALWIRGDEDLLREGLGNLVENAIKFTPAGGAVSIIAASHEGRAHIEVLDSGPGVPPAERDKIFRRFYRSAANASEAGHGLGLSIARTIAELHGFNLNVEDSAQGARFVMSAKTSLVPVSATIRAYAPPPSTRAGAS